MAEDEYGQQEGVPDAEVLVVVYQGERLQGHPDIRVERVRHLQGVLLERAQPREVEDKAIRPINTVSPTEP